MELRRRPGQGWLVLIGGGEWSFGETLAVDAAWLEKTEPGEIGFLPAASGSGDYARHFAAYLEESFQRRGQVVPIYRRRDARRERNCELLKAAAGIYLGGGVTDSLVEALEGSPAAQVLDRRLDEGGVVVAMAASAQAAGRSYRSLVERRLQPGFGWLPQGVVEPNFDPAHDRRLRRLVAAPGVKWGLGLPPASAVLLGPGEAVEYVGPAFGVGGPDGDLVRLGQWDEEAVGSP